MVIYKHNLAEKLFGFAYSKEFLRENTDLCPFVDDPNLSLDIDLAVEFHKALRSDPIAAEKVTNLLILSSSYIDVSTAEFYTDKMKTYPVFDDHINRINDLFDSLPDIPKKDPNSLPDDEREREEIGRYINEQLTTFPKVSGIAPTTPEGIPFPTPEKILYERVSLATGYTPQQLSDIAFNSNFNNALKNALEDCLNSPCNLFSETSDSIASLANQASMMNSTTMPTWGELKNNFFNAIGGVPDTIFKKVPMSIKNSIIELGQIGQQAMEQSTEMFFAKDPDKKKKIIQKALAGQSLNTDSTGYKYLPDLDSYLNVTKMSSKILKKAADDLGGCFNKFQQAARYEPYNPEHNKSFTSKDPINNKRGDDSFSMNTTGKTNNDYEARTTTSMSSCSPSQVEPATGSGTRTDVDVPITSYNAGEKNNNLAMDRLSRFSGELGANKEQILARLQALAAREVGSNPAAQQAFIETVVNRAYFSNRSLNTILYESAYGFTGTDTASPSPGLRAAFDNVFAGSNLTNLATDAGYNLPGAGPGGSNFVTGNKQKQVTGVMDLRTGQLITDSNLLNTLNTKGDTTGRYEYFVRQDRKTTRAGIDLYAKSRGIN